MSEYETILCATDEAIATITLNRPVELNRIVPPMPDEIEAAVNEAARDEAITVIVLRGAGRSFCGGFDFGDGFVVASEDAASARPAPACGALT